MHRQIKILTLINGFSIFAVNMFLPLYALFAQRIGSTIFHVGGIWSFYVFSSGALVFLLSRYENRLKYADYFLILGFLMRAAGWAGYIFAGSVLHLYLIQIFLAFGEAFGTPSFLFLFSSYLDRGEFATEWGLYSSAKYFLMGGAAFASAVIVEVFGFDVLFVCMIVLSLISTIFAVRFRDTLRAV